LTDGTQVPLNRTEHLFWAGEGQLGSIHEPYLVRFDSPVEADELRQILRELISAYDRLRGVVVPTGWTYKLQILPDDNAIDVLLADAFKVVRGVDADVREEVNAFHTSVLNEVISMERGLSLKAWFIPHASKPILIFSIHHIIGDGRSLLQMIAAILARLNGTPIKPVPLQSPSMVPAVVPTSFSKWPATILGWWRNMRRDAEASRHDKMVTLVKRQSQRFTTSKVHYHDLRCTTRQLRATAKQMGTTVNSLMTAVFANALLAREPNTPNAAAVIRISYDLRKLFPDGKGPEVGNFVSSFTVRARRQPTLMDQIKSIEASVKDQLARYERREYAVPLLLYELLPAMGRRLYALMIKKAKEGGKLQDVSCHFSNLGAADFLNAPDAKRRLQELVLVAQPVVPIFGLASVGDRLFFSSVHQIDEVDPEDVAAFASTLEAEVLALIKAGEAQTAAASAATA
jgi:NRPS condensation-like uncharacterized protein